jgi:hypothetical protein
MNQLLRASRGDWELPRRRTEQKPELLTTAPQRSPAWEHPVSIESNSIADLKFHNCHFFASYSHQCCLHVSRCHHLPCCLPHLFRLDAE